MFTSLDAHDRPLEDGDRLQWYGVEPISVGFVAVTASKYVETLHIDGVGHLCLGNGRALEDIVADVTVGNQSLAIRMYDAQEKRWVVVGAPYREEFAPLKHSAVLDARCHWVEADIDLRYARSRQREEPCLANCIKAEAALIRWERALAEWGREIEGHPDSDSRLQWYEADHSRVPIPESPQI